MWWGVAGNEQGQEEGKKSTYLCLRYFRVGGDVAVVLVGEFGLSFAEVFASGVEGGFRHGGGGGSNEVLDVLV